MRAETKAAKIAEPAQTPVSRQPIDPLENQLSQLFRARVNRREAIILGAAGLGTLGLAACGSLSSGTTVSGPDFKLGLVLPSSKVYAQLGADIGDGIALYFDSVGNKAGGRNLKTLKEDEAADPATALTATRKLVEQSNVDMIGGFVSSAAALGARDYLDQNKMPTVLSQSGANALSRAKKSKYIYRVSNSSWQNGTPIGKYVGDNVSKKVVMVYANYAAGQEIAAAFKETFTGTLGPDVKPPLFTTDYSSFITEIQKSSPEAIFVFLAGADAIGFIKLARQVGLFDQIKVTASGYFLEQDVLDAVADAAPLGAVSCLDWAPSLTNKENTDFVSNFTKRYNRKPSVYAEHGFDTGRVIVEALNKVNGDTSNRDALLDAISKVTFNGPRGPFSFDAATNNVVNTMYIRELRKGQAGLSNEVITSTSGVTDPGK
ncbi:MAG: ABC transporter substrate-binding protein [Candidatus Dormiibacterota bacterium]